jgi:hypothetical protein
VSHWLVILEKGEDYDIEHESDCPQIDILNGPDGELIKDHNCLIGWLVREAGLELLHGALEDSWRSLSVGRYEIEGWTAHYPSTPNGPEEWDAGIYLVENG